MEKNQPECNHTCRNTCAMLNDAIREETSMIRLYERVLNECNYPDVHTFIREILEERSRSVIRIMQKLNELKARGQMLDGIISSYESPSS